jgi:catechol 2,3-dioxygenase-like lactoylglutathione lyase family enzyme
MINAVHSILYARDAGAARAFFADVLGLDSVDAGGGWLIFALPPAELAVHPADSASHELYLMTDDLGATLDALRARGVAVVEEPVEQSWGVVARVDVPGFGPLGVYEPSHPVPRRTSTAAR